jgi:hypothetical protein
MKRILIILVLITFIAVGGFGFLYPVISDHHHESVCPFMSGEQVICKMDILGHISAWQKSFTIPLPSFLIILILFTFCVMWKLFEQPPNLYLKSLIFSKRNFYRLIILYQQLFSKVILNPRAP